MYAYTELVDVPISISAILELDTMKYTMCSIMFRDQHNKEIETWDNELFIIDFCEALKKGLTESQIENMLNKEELSNLDINYISKYSNEIIKLYNKARELKLL